VFKRYVSGFDYALESEENEVLFAPKIDCLCDLPSVLLQISFRDRTITWLGLVTKGDVFAKFRWCVCKGGWCAYSGYHFQLLFIRIWRFSRMQHIVQAKENIETWTLINKAQYKTSKLSISAQRVGRTTTPCMQHFKSTHLCPARRWERIRQWDSLHGHVEWTLAECIWAIYLIESVDSTA